MPRPPGLAALGISALVGTWLSSFASAQELPPTPNAGVLPQTFRATAPPFMAPRRLRPRIGQVERAFLRLPPLDAMVVGVVIDGAARAWFLDDLGATAVRNAELAGQALEPVPVVLTSFGAWIAANPGTEFVWPLPDDGHPHVINAALDGVPIVLLQAVEPPLIAAWSLAPLGEAPPTLEARRHGEAWLLVDAASGRTWHAASGLPASEPPGPPLDAVSTVTVTCDRERDTRPGSIPRRAPRDPKTGR